MFSWKCSDWSEKCADMKIIVVLLAMLAVATAITSNCLDCIRLVENGTANACADDDGTMKCGRYKISEDYWTDCGSLGDSWSECSFDEVCARRCIKAYMELHDERAAIDLGNGITIGQLKCHDYGRLHIGGPGGIIDAVTCAYVERIRAKCYANSPPHPGSPAPPRPASVNDCP